MAPTVTQPSTYTRPMDPYHYHRPDHDEKRDITAAQAECTFGFDDDSEREPPCRHEHGPKSCRRRTTRLGLIILFLLLGLVAFLVVGWSPFLASAFGLGGGNGGGHAYDAVEVKNVLGFLVGRAVLDATGQPSAAADGSGTLIDRKCESPFVFLYRKKKKRPFVHYLVLIWFYPNRLYRHHHCRSRLGTTGWYHAQCVLLQK